MANYRGRLAAPVIATVAKQTARMTSWRGTGPHLTAGNAPDNNVASFQEKPTAAAGALAAAGWQFRGEHGFLLAVEVSTVYSPSAANVRQASGGRLFPGGAVMLGYAR